MKTKVGKSFLACVMADCRIDMVALLVLAGAMVVSYFLT